MFEPDRLYLTDDPELTAVWSPSTLANWRYEKRGPAYSKTGKRILYQGRDLIEFVDRHRVEPAAA